MNGVSEVTESAKSVIHDAMAAKGGRPFYIYDITDEETGEITATVFDCSKYSEYLNDYFNIKNFNGVLYIYDKDKQIYKQQQNEINTHIRDNYVKWGVSKLLQAWVREINTHIMAMGNESVYPFNTSINTVPVANGVIEFDYDTKIGLDYDSLSIIKENDGIIRTPDIDFRKHVKLLPHGPEHLFTFKLSVIFDESAKLEPAFLLLKQWVDNPNSLLQIPAQALLQTQHGHSYKKAHLLQGEPHAGKTSFITLLYRVFPQEFTEAIRLQQVCEDRFVGGNLEGKLLNMYDDLEDLPLNTIEPFKTLTGSCTHGIERKYEKHYTGRITAVHIFSCNYPPEYPDKVKRDSAFWERWEYIKFPFSYPVDPNFYERVFTDKLIASFFNAIIDSMIRIKKSGLLVKSEVQDVMLNWSINSDPLFEFITWGFGANTGTTPNTYSKSKLLKYYINYCNDHNIPEYKRKSSSLKAFTTALQPHGFMPQKIRKKDNSYEVYITTTYKSKPDILQDLDYTTEQMGQKQI